MVSIWNCHSTFMYIFLLSCGWIASRFDQGLGACVGEILEVPVSQKSVCAWRVVK